MQVALLLTAGILIPAWARTCRRLGCPECTNSRKNSRVFLPPTPSGDPVTGVFTGFPHRRHLVQLHEQQMVQRVLGAKDSGMPGWAVVGAGTCGIVTPLSSCCPA